MKFSQYLARLISNITLIDWLIILFFLLQDTLIYFQDNVEWTIHQINLIPALKNVIKDCRLWFEMKKMAKTDFSCFCLQLQLNFFISSPLYSCDYYNILFCFFYFLLFLWGFCSWLCSVFFCFWIFFWVYKIKNMNYLFKQ